MPIKPISERDEVQIDLHQLTECIDSWHPSDGVGYRLFLIEELTRGPSDAYILTEYTSKDAPYSEDVILGIGQIQFEPFSFTHEPVFTDDSGISELSSAQWQTVEKAYADFCVNNFKNSIFEGVPEVYEELMYSSVDDFGDALRHYLDRVHHRIERAQSTDADECNEFSELEQLSDKQVSNIGAVAGMIEHPQADVDLSSVELGASFSFDTLEPWEVRALEHLLQGVFVNKPELAKTKALLEADYTQAEIAELLGKDASTVSRQVASVTALENRARWTVEQQDAERESED